MAERDKDKLADALNALVGGQHAEPEGTPSGPDPVVDLTPPAQRAGRPAAPGSVPPAPAPPKKPTAATAASVPRPPAPPAKPPATAPLFRASARPATPGAAATPARPDPASPSPARPSKPRTARPEQPVAPTAATPPPAAAAPPPAPVADPDPGLSAADQLAAVSDDDDQLDLPAATPDMLAHLPAQRHRATAVVTTVSAVSHSAGFKRTIIPILLTCGVLLPATAALKWLADAESPLARLPSAVVIGCCVVGAALLAIAALNMLQVRDELARAKAASAGAAGVR